MELCTIHKVWSTPAASKKCSMLNRGIVSVTANANFFLITIAAAPTSCNATSRTQPIRSDDITQDTCRGRMPIWNAWQLRDKHHLKNRFSILVRLPTHLLYLVCLLTFQLWRRQVFLICCSSSIGAINGIVILRVVGRWTGAGPRDARNTNSKNNEDSHFVN